MGNLWSIDEGPNVEDIGEEGANAVATDEAHYWWTLNEVKDLITQYGWAHVLADLVSLKEKGG